MSEQSDTGTEPMREKEPALAKGLSTSTRRGLLQLGVAAIPAAVTLTPGMAWATSNNCRVNIPYLKQQNGSGRVTPINSNDPVPHGYTRISPPRPGQASTSLPYSGVGYYYGSEIQAGGLPSAHLAYLSQVRSGEGLTCLHSLLPTRY